MSRKDFYRSDKWKSVNPLARATILLVSEGVKPGCTFSSNYRVDAEMAMDKLGLSYFEPLWFNNRYIYTASKDENTLLEYIGKSIGKHFTSSQAHKAAGEFYGFPECCVDRFVGGRLHYGSNRKQDSFNFSDMLRDYIKSHGEYPEALDYRMMVPCAVDCEEALKVAGGYRDVLLEYDEEAASALRLMNQRAYRMMTKQ